MEVVSDDAEFRSSLVGVGDGDEDIYVTIFPSVDFIGFLNECFVEVGHDSGELFVSGDGLDS